jgi:lipopolysaccharide/colanic/teichoic acid biosynthesis glycosyltransferase
MSFNNSSALDNLPTPVESESVRRRPRGPGTIRVSRFDTLSWLSQVFLSLLGLIILSPVLLLVAIVIKITDKGPVFYRGDRVGIGERIFRIYKFRTLIPGAEENIGARLLNPEDRSLYQTKIGRFLKRSKLDEVPQLINVIRGEMRLAGPRPIRPVFLNRFKQEIRDYTFRFLAPPGITGIAQLRGGYYTSPRNKLRYDLIYLRNRSLLLDLKIILLTFAKILNRKLSGGFFVLFLFLFVSFIPPSLLPLLYLPLFGVNVSVIQLFIILVSSCIFLKIGPRQISLFRSPLNLPLVSFVGLTVSLALFSSDPFNTLQGAAYYVVTGFLVSFMIVNSLGTKTFMTLMVRVVALTSVVLSLFGLFQIFMVNYTVALAASLPPERILDSYARISSIPGNPKVLAVYLVLGIPLLLSEVIRAQSQRGRDFWLVCTTLSIIGIFFTQSRLGLLALMVTGTIFLYRRLNHALFFFSTLLLLFLFLVALGIPRFSLSGIRDDLGEWIEERVDIVEAFPAKAWLLGGIGPMTVPNPVTEPEGYQRSELEETALINNMHLTLMLEHGFGGWLVMIWLIVSSVWAMKQAYDKSKDENLKIMLWAIISSVLGFLVSMNGMNTFHNLTIQVFFWSLIGIGLALAIQLNGQSRHNLVWRFGDAGD